MMMARQAVACDAAPEMARMKMAVCDVQEQALSTEYTIARPTNVPSSGDATKVGFLPPLSSLIAPL